jgi:hypothetical protein
LLGRIGVALGVGVIVVSGDTREYDSLEAADERGTAEGLVACVRGDAESIRGLLPVS